MSQSTDPEDSHHVLDPAVDPFTYHQLPGEDSQANRQSRYALLDHGPNVPALVPDGDGALDSEDVTGPSSSTSVSDPHEPSLVPPEPIRFNALSPSLVNSSARDSFATGLRASPEPAKTFLSSENPSRTLLGEKNGSQQGVDGVDEARAVSTRRRRRKWWIISAVAIAFVVIALAVILPVVLVAVKNNSHTSSGLSGGGGGDGGDGGGGGGAPK